MDLEETLCDGQLSLGAYYFISFVCLYVCLSVWICVCQHQTYFAYKWWMDGWIMMILTHMTYIDDTLKLTKGQGQRSKVKFTYAYAYFVDNSLLFEVHSLVMQG